MSTTAYHWVCEGVGTHIREIVGLTQTAIGDWYWLKTVMLCGWEGNHCMTESNDDLPQSLCRDMGRHWTRHSVNSIMGVSSVFNNIQPCK